jgi:hypothetical protein
MPNGRAALISKTNAAGRELWLVPIDGAQPHKLDLGVPDFAMCKVHPDGKRIAYVTPESKMEAWALENFLPALNAAQ